MKRHKYGLEVVWTGSRGVGTTTYTSYDRDHEIKSTGKPAIGGSSDPAFRGNAARYNPEELLVAGLSACHMLAYLHLCAVGGVVVTAYEDQASGTMVESGESASFEEVTLRPRVTISPDSDAEKAAALHDEAHRRCFIANSVNFPVRHEPVITKAIMAA